MPRITLRCAHLCILLVNTIIPGYVREVNILESYIFTSRRAKSEDFFVLPSLPTDLDFARGWSNTKERTENYYRKVKLHTK